MSLSYKSLQDWILKQNDIAIVSHIRPDGDTTGSALALCSGLKRLGKNCCCCDDTAELPRDLRFLPGSDAIAKPDKFPFKPGAVFFVDVSDAGRAGASLALAEGVPTAVLDHHGTNPVFCDVNVIDPDAGATGILVTELLTELGLELTREEGLCLYAAISTDTGNFSFGNTDSRAMLAVAKCLDTGFDISDASRRLFRLRSASQVHLIGSALSAMQFAAEGRIAYTVFTEKMLRECGASHAETADIINFLNETEGVEAAFSAEECGEKTRFSLRSVERVDVAKIALAMGGGGHARAAGVTLDLPVEEAVQTMLEKMISAL